MSDDDSFPFVLSPGISADLVMKTLYLPGMFLMKRCFSVDEAITLVMFSLMQLGTEDPDLDIIFRLIQLVQGLEILYIYIAPRATLKVSHRRRPRDIFLQA